MGLFDFLKNKGGSATRNESQAALNQLRWLAELEKVEKQAGNLRTVGREDEATKVAVEFLNRAMQVWASEPSNTQHVTFITTAAIRLNSPQVGERFLSGILESDSLKKQLDLTLVYSNLGRIYHRMMEPFERELWAYHMATVAVAPANCRCPASPRDKVAAHFGAFLCARRGGNAEHQAWHDRKCRELAPEVNWDNPMAALAWLKG